MDIKTALHAINPDMPLQEKADAVLTLLKQEAGSAYDLHYQLARDVFAGDEALCSLLLWHELEVMMTPRADCR